MHPKHSAVLRMACGILLLWFGTAFAAETASQPPDSSWRAYSSHHISLHYPGNAKAYTMAPKKIFTKIGCGEFKDSIILCVMHTPKDINPSLHEAITISLRSNIQSESDCMQFLHKGQPEQQGKLISREDINGVALFKVSGEDAGKDSRMVYSLYHAFHDNTCYEIKSGYFTGSDGKKTSSDSVKKLKADLNRILATFRFTD